MKIKPVIKQRAPRYPVIEFFVAHPELLSQSVPANWLTNKWVSASLAAFVLCGSLDSCSSKGSKSVEMVEKTTDRDAPQGEQDQKTAYKVAPVFAHGEGSGATGCIVMSPPVFLSEDEALKLIFDALASYQLSFETDSCPVIHLKGSKKGSIGTDMEVVEEEIEDVFIPHPDSITIDHDVDLKMDGYHKGLNLGILFVSDEDALLFDNHFSSSITSYGTKGAACLIRKELARHGTMNAALFYDPIVELKGYDYDGKEKDGWEKAWRRANVESAKEAKALLLAQVNDFIEWLKKEQMIQP